MKIVVGLVDSQEGRVALERAVDEARLRQSELIIVRTLPLDPASEEAVAQQGLREEFEKGVLAGSGISYTIRDMCRGRSLAEEILNTAEQESAELIVVGLRRRSPVGKMFLGATGQDVLLNAECPVLGVKP